MENENEVKYTNLSTNLIEIVTDNGSLYYCDILSYGTFKCVEEEEKNKILQNIGPDIMDATTTLDLQMNKKTNAEKAIGNVIVNQKIIAGIGNYLRSDILWLSKINPFRKVKDISIMEWKEMYTNCKRLTWGMYDREHAILIDATTLLPCDYNRLHYKKEDIHKLFLHRKYNS